MRLYSVSTPLYPYTLHNIEWFRIQKSPTFLATGDNFMGDNFSTDQRGGDGFGMIQMHYIYCELNFYYYYTSDHQAWDLRDREPIV